MRSQIYEQNHFKQFSNSQLSFNCTLIFSKKGPLVVQAFKLLPSTNVQNSAPQCATKCREELDQSFNVHKTCLRNRRCASIFYLWLQAFLSDPLNRLVRHFKNTWSKLNTAVAPVEVISLSLKSRCCNRQGMMVILGLLHNCSPQHSSTKEIEAH